MKLIKTSSNEINISDVAYLNRMINELYHKAQKYGQSDLYGDLIVRITSIGNKMYSYVNGINEHERLNRSLKELNKICRKEFKLLTNKLGD